MPELAFQLLPEPGCIRCEGRGKNYSAVHGDFRPCPCRQPTAVLRVRGTAEAREGLRDLVDIRSYCEMCGSLDPDACEDHLSDEGRITCRILEWTGEEPLDLMALAEAEIEGCDCLGGHDPRECGGLTTYSLPGVDGVIVATHASGCSAHLTHCPQCNREEEVVFDAERLGLEVEYAD